MLFGSWVSLIHTVCMVDRQAGGALQHPCYSMDCTVVLILILMANI